MSQAVKKPGRPKKAQIDTLEVTLAKKYQAYIALGDQFLRGIDSQYPRVSNEHKVQLKHLIFSAAEEHRLWADVDNLLLSVQRHKTLTQQLIDVRDNVIISFVQLESIYTLILKSNSAETSTGQQSMPLESGPSIVNGSEWLSDFEENKTVISHWLKMQLHNHSAHEQALWLSATSHALRSALVIEDENSTITVDTIKNVRQIIRGILLSISKHKIDPLFKSQDKNQAGRPTLPIPTQLLRSEDSLLSTYRSYRLACQRLHRKSLSSQQVWEKNKHAIESTTLGRRTMPTLRVLINKQLGLKTERYCLTIDKEHIIEEFNRKNENKRGTKGRPALTYDQKVRKIDQQLDEVDALIKQQKTRFSTDTKSGLSFKQQTLEYQFIWLENKLKRQPLDSEQSQSKSANACLQYWSTSLEEIKSLK
ncbi:hypothetical protein [uncultured Vibrio sp.]|uniref:hypothetical protein n=1 Tax=uncultured Vibrio sp. TaxID=114054 RepID=UPI000919FD96|nr:hypothetical protein [uncultured Vibrio sp.]OIQ26412.1 MAG: hypothetical protein BM561_01220 [Vibrio sp. MedPE-SWchi]